MLTDNTSWRRQPAAASNDADDDADDQRPHRTSAAAAAQRRRPADVCNVFLRRKLRRRRGEQNEPHRQLSAAEHVPGRRSQPLLKHR